jgi:4-amino-4-deoxy-L-arabinose transferase-like glycosyltransferase
MLHFLRSYWFLFVIALMLRFALIAGTVGLSAPPKGAANPDQLDYELFAANLAAGHGYVLEVGKPTACRAPGTSFALYPVYLLFGRDFFMARIWFALLSALCVPITGRIAARLHSPQAGWLAAAWLCCYPGHMYYAIHFLSETPATLLIGLILLLQIETLRRPWNWRDVVLGLCIGFGILNRPSIGIFAVTGCLLPLLVPTLTWRQRWAKCTVIGMTVVLVVAPWLVRNKIVVHKVTIATIVPGYTFWGANNERTYHDPATLGYWIACSELVDADHPLEGDELQMEAAAWHYGTEYSQAHRADLPRVMLHRFGRVIWAYSESDNRLVDWAFRVSWLVSLPFVLLGLWHTLRTRRLESLLLVQGLLMVGATTVAFYGCSRFRDVIAPILAVLVAQGVLYLFQNRLRWNKRVTSGPASLVS